MAGVRTIDWKNVDWVAFNARLDPSRLAYRAVDGAEDDACLALALMVALCNGRHVDQTWKECHAALGNASARIRKAGAAGAAALAEVVGGIDRVFLEFGLRPVDLGGLRPTFREAYAWYGDCVVMPVAGDPGRDALTCIWGGAVVAERDTSELVAGGGGGLARTRTETRVARAWIPVDISPKGPVDLEMLQEAMADGGPLAAMGAERVEITGGGWRVRIPGARCGVLEGGDAFPVRGGPLEPGDHIRWNENVFLPTNTHGAPIGSTTIEADVVSAKDGALKPTQRIELVVTAADGLSAPAPGSEIRRTAKRIRRKGCWRKRRCGEGPGPMVGGRMPPCGPREIERAGPKGARRS